MMTRMLEWMIQLGILEAARMMSLGERQERGLTAGELV